ncbi:MAG: hypothetical protein R3F61_06700 [Myxococcota bacterium]
MILALLAGCVSMSGLGTGRTLDRHQVRAFGGTEVGYTTARPLLAGRIRTDLGVRYGLTDDWELGGHVGGWVVGALWGQVGVDVKRRLLRAPNDRSGWDVSVSAAFTADGVWSGGGSGAALAGQVPLFVSKNLPNRSEVVFVPRVALQHIRSRGAYPVTKPLAGLSVGYAMHSGRFTLYPALGALVSTNPADPVSNLVSWEMDFGFGYDFGPGTSRKER